MTESCIICETEPIDMSDWYRCPKTTEVVCPWCIEDIGKMVHKLRNMGD